MRQHEFNKNLSVITQLPVKTIESMIQVMVNRLTVRLRGGNIIAIPMFATFYVRKWERRNMWNIHLEMITGFPAFNVATASQAAVQKKSMNPNWCITRTFSDIRQYPDSELANRMFLVMQTDLWQIRLFIYEFALYANTLIQANDKIVLPHFGTFTRRTRAAHTARDPHTGFPVSVEERYYLRFRQSPTLKDLVN